MTETTAYAQMGFSDEQVREWIDFFGECLLMGVPIVVSLTLAEALTAGRSRLVMNAPFHATVSMPVLCASCSINRQMRCSNSRNGA